MNKVSKIKNKLLISFLSILLAFFLVVPSLIVHAAGQFEGGNLFLAGNTTHPEAGWGDPIPANVGDIIEFKAQITNTGDQPITNTTVKADLPTNVSGGTLVTTIHVRGDGVSGADDNATVLLTNTPTIKSLQYFPGHAVMTTPQGSFPLPETITTSGVSIGTVNPGNVNYIEVIFKATVTEVAAPTPTPTSTPVPTNTPTPTPTGVPTATPTPVPSVTPTPTSTPGPTATPTPTSTPGPTATPTPTTTPGAQVQQPELQCPAGFVSTVSGSTIICLQQVQQQQQNQEVNITNNPSITNTNTVTAPAPQVVEVKGVTTAVSELPKTGLPLVAWGLGALLPVGLGLRKFGGRAQDVKKTADYLWQKREFSKD